MKKYLLIALLFAGCTKENAIMPTSDDTYNERLYHYNKMIQIASMAEVRSGLYLDSLNQTGNPKFKDSVAKYATIYNYAIFNNPKPQNK